MILGVIGYGRRCSRQPKFSLEPYISINQTFISLTNSHKKNLYRIKIWPTPFSTASTWVSPSLHKDSGTASIKHAVNPEFLGLYRGDFISTKGWREEREQRKKREGKMEIASGKPTERRPKLELSTTTVFLFLSSLFFYYVVYVFLVISFF